MLKCGDSLFSLKDYQSHVIYSFFEKIQKEKLTPLSCNKNIGLCFLEPSTRTLLSFEMSAKALGAQSLRLEESYSSVKKGESLLDTLLTLENLGVDALVVRHGGRESLEALSKELHIPIINAGEGTSGHPTQGLLDVYTLYESWGREFKGKKVLYVGDVLHSRVFYSGYEILTQLGVSIGIAGLKQWLPKNQGVQVDFKEGLRWCDAVVMLRYQYERHKEEGLNVVQSEKYQLNADTLQTLGADAVILHPGAFS